MRFETKFDRWPVIVLVVTTSLAIVVPASFFLSPGPDASPPILAYFFPLVWVAVVSCAWPQYYEVRDGGLFIRQGWRKNVIPYASLVEVQSVSDARTAAVFSTDRIVIVLTSGKRFVIALAEDDRFLSELAKCCPQLERRAFGLSTPLSPPLII
jgi:Bacterial PH domain